MWKLKACPRCGGDVFLDRGLDGWSVHCLQCGYERELADIRYFKSGQVEKEPEKKREPVLARKAGQ